MKKHKISLVFSFAISAFILSLGAPIGFYFHDYLFNSSGDMGFWGHIQYLNTNELSTLIYISFGTIFFFTSFGAILGYYADKTIHLEQNKILEGQHKKNLFIFLLNDIKRPVALVRESLLFLKKGSLSSLEQDKIISSLGKEMEAFNQVIDTLINLDNSDLNNSSKTNNTEMIKILDELTIKYDIIIDRVPNDNNTAPFWIKISPTLLLFMLENLFRFLQEHEIEVNEIEVESRPIPRLETGSETKKYIKNTSVTCLSFKLKNRQVQDNEIPLLIELIKQFEGYYSSNDNSLLIYLPADIDENKNSITREVS